MIISMSQIVYTENVMEYLTLSTNTRQATDFNFSLVQAIAVIATGYELDGRGVGFRVPVEGKAIPVTGHGGP
jgi:hypothetical protein